MTARPPVRPHAETLNERTDEPDTEEQERSNHVVSLPDE